MKKKNLDRLKRLVSYWQKHEQEKQSKFGNEVPGSMRAAQNKDCAALTEAIKFIEEVKHGKRTKSNVVRP